MTPEEKLARVGVTELLKIIGAAQTAIAERIRKAVESGKDSTAYYDAQLRQIEKLYAAIEASFASYATAAFTRQYEAGWKLAEEILIAAGQKAVSEAPRVTTVAQMVADSVARLHEATQGGLGEIKTLFRKTQQAVLHDALINQTLAKGVMGSDTIPQLTKLLRSEFYKAIGDGEKVLLINGRRYKVDAYCELVARTRTREAQSLATIDAVQRYGQDLVQVSRHNTETPLCQGYEGKRYSITGRTPGYPILDARPPFHPNCWHVLTPFIADEKKVLMEPKTL